MPTLAEKIKAKAAQAYGAAKKASATYFRPDYQQAEEAFDYKKSQKEREESAAAKERIDQTSKTQRVSGRKKSRANELAKVHGRTDEEKIKSQAVASRNRRVARDVLLTAAPGGAASSALAKGQKVVKAGKYLAQAGKGNLAKGASRLAATGVKKAAKQGLKTTAKKAGGVGYKVGKYIAKTKAQGAANVGVGNIGIG